jgi:hypothetical protein
VTPNSNCPVCSAPPPANPWITGIIYKPYTNDPLAIAYRCVPPCTNNRDIKWPDGSDAEREAAKLAQLSLDAANEMMMGRV